MPAAGEVPEGVSRASMVFGTEAPAHASTWMEATRGLDEASASREEVIGAVLLGLQPGGHRVTACLPAAIDAYDATEDVAER